MTEIHIWNEPSYLYFLLSWPWWVSNSLPCDLAIMMLIFLQKSLDGFSSSLHYGVY